MRHRTALATPLNRGRAALAAARTARRRRTILILAALALVATACQPSPVPGPPPSVLAEVTIPGQPSASTHGDDQLPPRPPSLFAQVAPEAPWPCEGDGTDGRRVQMLYLHGGQSNLGTLRPTIETFSRQIEGMFLTSGRESGGERLLRLVTGPGCSLSIIERQVSANALASFDAMISELRGLGFSESNRAYHAFVESNSYCGIGTVYSDDARVGNLNESNAHYSRTDRPCWSAHTAAHEVVHNLGGVQNSAPNSTGGLHCRDEHDVMCYPDGAPRGQMVTVCPDVAGEDRFDCGKDDYFSAAPPAGSYLATHWNVADSSALVRSPGVTTTIPPPSPTTTLPPTTTTTVGRGETKTELELPATLRQGVPFTATARVSGDCGPTGTVAFYVSGKLMSKQVIDRGTASVTLTVLTSVSRPTFRADYSGDARCSTSRDTVRKTVR